MYAKGVFSMCWQLIQDDAMDEEDAELFKEIDAWFAEHLPWPEPCKNREAVVCWFKTENTEEMMRMIRPAMWLLETVELGYYLVVLTVTGTVAGVLVGLCGALLVKRVPKNL